MNPKINLSHVSNQRIAKHNDSVILSTSSDVNKKVTPLVKTITISFDEKCGGSMLVVSSMEEQEEEKIKMVDARPQVSRKVKCS